MLATEPTEIKQPSEPADPMDKIEPAEPIDKIEPDEPMDNIEPLEPMLRIDPDEPAERDEPLLIPMGTFCRIGLRRGVAGVNAAGSPPARQAGGNNLGEHAGNGGEKPRSVR